MKGFTPLEIKNLRFLPNRKRVGSLTGFTLIEMMISVAIFAIVMTIALGALLAMSESDRKAQTLKSVINNLNFAMDSMSRSIRTGDTYHCDASQTPITTTRDCASSPVTSFAFHPAVGGGTVIYKLNNLATDATTCGQPSTRVGCIARSIDGGAYSSMTSPEVYIDTLNFYVNGAQDSSIQPKVTILVSGTVTVTATQTSKFNLQTSVTQRLYDQ